MVIRTGKRARLEESNDDGYSPDSSSDEDESPADKELRIESQTQALAIRKKELENLKKKEAMVSQFKLGLNNMEKVLNNTAATSNPQSLPTMETLEKFHELLMDKIELVVDTLKSQQIIRSRSKALILEIIRSGTITPDQVDRLDASCVDLLISRLPILRVERRGNKHQVLLNDFSS